MDIISPRINFRQAEYLSVFTYINRQQKTGRSIVGSFILALPNLDMVRLALDGPLAHKLAHNRYLVVTSQESGWYIWPGGTM
jgi:hypothetical protein